MREYMVLEVKCKKDLQIQEIYKYIEKKAKYNHNFFAFQNLHFDSLNKECKQLYEQIGLDCFRYKKVLEHLAKRADYNPDRDDRQMISNVDSRWEWNNEKETRALGEQELELLIAFCEKLKKGAAATFIVGLDEIEWDGKKSSKGTYGYQKADCTYGLGKNYLSNSITLGRLYADKAYTAYISCEKHFREHSIINEIIDFLGEIKTESVHFAPENEEERKEWETAQQMAEAKFRMTLSGLDSLPLKLIEKRRITDSSCKINIGKYIKTHLCKNGWETRKAFPDEHPTIIHKCKGNADVCLSILSGHNGHHLQAIVYYRSPQFLFANHIYALSYNEISADDVEIYFQNVEIVRDYLYESL